MEWLNFRHLYSFWMVSREGGFKNAANKMLVSQSAVSEQVAQLEEYLGETLFERTTRSLNLTPTGSTLLNYADGIFQTSRDINHFIRDHKTSPTPLSMRVGIVGGISRNFLYRFLNNVIHNLPNVKIEVVNGSFEELATLIKAFELDVAFSLEPPTKKDTLSLTYKRVGQSPLCLAGKKPMVRKARNKTKSAMTIYNFKRHLEAESLNKALKKRFGKLLDMRFETDDISLLRFFANAGEGLAVIPEVGVQEDITSGAIERIILSEVEPVNIYAIYLKSGMHKKLVEDLL